MKLFQIIPFIISCSLLSQVAVAELKTERAVLDDDDNITTNAEFSVAEQGDLYVATKINDQLIFFANGGKDLVPTPTPFIRNGNFSGTVPLFDISAEGVPAGRYPLYQVITKTNSDPLDTRNWKGKLSIINFMINLATTENGDLDDDGFADNDLNHDGFYDDDKNQDGFHDDDRNKDGYRDGDLNRNGSIDEDESQAKEEDEDDPENPTDNKGDDDKPVSTDPAILQGKSFYSTCADSACHGPNPKANEHNILSAAEDHKLILNAIKNNTGGMSILNNTITEEAAKNVSAYLKSL